MRIYSSLAKVALLLAVSSLILLMPAYGQTVRGVVSGYVLDPTNAPIKGAAIKLVDRSTGRERSATAGSAGQFVVPNVPPGEYRMTVTQAGFTAYTELLTVSVNRDIDLEVKLLIGHPDTVEVTAPIDPLKTDSATVSGSISRHQLQSLPLD